jgi:phosphonate transport system substrate-binding protein
LLALLLVGTVAAACGSATPETSGPADAGLAVNPNEEEEIATLQAEADAAAAARAAAGLGPAIGTAENPLVMSFVPSGELEEIVAGSDAVRDLLEKETGLDIETNVATSYAAVIEAMGAGNAHAAWLPTISYIIAQDKFGVRPILVVGRFGSTSYASQIITRADSGITSLADLKGMTFCRPDPLSTSGWIIPMVVLKANGVAETDLGKIVDSGGHSGVVTAVYNGDCDAGATFVDARGDIEQDFPDVKTKVVVLDTSDAIPNDNVSVIAELPEETASQLSRGLLAIAGTDEGLEALKTVYGVETLEPIDDTFYDDFRATLTAAGMDPAQLLPQE